MPVSERQMLAYRTTSCTASFAPAAYRRQTREGKRRGREERKQSIASSEPLVRTRIEQVPVTRRPDVMAHMLGSRCSEVASPYRAVIALVHALELAFACLR